MGAEVYVDLYFLINASMDFFCLLITLRLLHLCTSSWRLALGAAMGGIYAVAALLLGLSGVLGFLADCAAAVFLCTVSLSPCGGWKRLLRAATVFVLTSMLLGGTMTALYTVLNRLDLPFEALQGEGISVWLFGILALVSGVLTARGGRFLGLSQKTKSVVVEAVLFGKSVTLHALVDSGNLLRDPISGRSVIIADRKRLSKLLPPILNEAQSATDPRLLSALQRDAKLASRVRLIPTQTAVGEGLLLALFPDSLTVTEGGERRQSDYLIAPSSLGESAHGFDAIISLF